MTNYKKLKDSSGVERADIIQRDDGACIPFAPANTDYARFKREIEAGTAELQDADGQPMSVADAKAYVATLP